MVLSATDREVSRLARAASTTSGFKPNLEGRSGFCKAVGLLIHGLKLNRGGTLLCAACGNVAKKQIMKEQRLGAFDSTFKLDAVSPFQKCPEAWASTLAIILFSF